MHTHGLPLHAFSAAGYKARSFLAWIVFFPLVAVSTWLKVHVSEPNLKGTPAAGQVMKCLSSFAGLCGEFWIVVGRRAVVREECRTALPPWAERWKPADKAAG
jgi:hypothetical protein